MTVECDRKDESTAIDSKARCEAVKPGQSVLVRAPAGSGKTTLLARRYVRLLKDGVEPERIACVTFTRKAAGEMRRKIQEEIDRVASGTEGEVSERLGKYAGPGHGSRIRVQTIDGFYRSLVRADSLMAGVMPNFKSGENRRHYYEVAGDAISRISPKPGPEGQTNTPPPPLRDWSERLSLFKVVDMVANRDRWMNVAEAVVDQETAKDEAAKDVVDQKTAKDEAAKDVLKFLHGIASDLAGVFSVEREYDHIEISRAASRLLKRLGDRLRLGRVLGYPIQHVLVDEFQDLSPAQFEFFEDLLRNYSGGRDDPHGGDRVKTFFAVGDSMQSIYGFRGAGMDVILRMFAAGERDKPDEPDKPGKYRTAKIGDHELRVEELTRNFRSTQNIVDGVEQLLKASMNDEWRAEGRTRLQEKVQGVDAEPTNYGGGLIVKVFDDEDAEARWVARKMEEHLKNEEKLAVLVRSRPQYLEKVVPELRRGDSWREMSSVGFQRLDLQACVNDIVTLGRCIEDPGDRSSGLALMRSPLVAMSSIEIHDAHHGCEAGTAPLCRVIDGSASDGAPVPGCWARKLERFGVAYLRARAEMRKMPVRGWLERAWVRAGGSAIYSRPADIRSLERFLDLVEEVHGDERFCDWDELMIRSQDIEDPGELPVKVMTIHKAKGLEFDTVIVPFLSRQGTVIPSRKLVLTGREKEGSDEKIDGQGDSKKDETNQIFVRYDKEGRDDDKAKEDVSSYAYKRGAALRKLQEEGRRLLYVAATRAKRTCWVSLTRPKAEEETPNPDVNSWSMAGRLELDRVKGDVKNGDKEGVAKVRVVNLERLDRLICELDKSRKVTVERGDQGDVAGPKEGSSVEPSGTDCDSGLLGAERGAEQGSRSVEPPARPGPIRSVGLRGLPSMKEKRSHEERESITEWTEKDRIRAAIGNIVHDQIGLMLLNWPACDGALVSEQWRTRWGDELRSELRRRSIAISLSDFKCAVERIERHVTAVARDRFMRNLAALASNWGEGWRLELEKTFRIKRETGGVEEHRVDVFLCNESDALVLEIKTGAKFKEHEKKLEKYRSAVKAAFGDNLRVTSALYYTDGHPESTKGEADGPRPELTVISRDGIIMALLERESAYSGAN